MIKKPKWFGFYTHHIGLYMKRWILVTPWGDIRLHHIMKSDYDRHLHDHPWNFTSYILKGGYVEHLSGGRKPLYYGAPATNRRKCWEAHRISLVPGQTAWTLVFTGRKFHDWGFHTENGFIPHKEYFQMFGLTEMSDPFDRKGI